MAWVASQPEQACHHADVHGPFERDGQVLLDGYAIRWDRTHVCVVLDDARLQVPYVWLGPADVRRR